MVVDKFMMITIAVGNMDKAKEFYTMLGLKATQDYSQAGQRWVALALPGGGASINLSTVLSSGKSATVENLKPGTVSLYFSTPDVEAVWKDLKEKGVTLTHEISKESWAGSPWAAWFSVSDPDGNQVLIVQLKSPGQ
jgi:uncharacterized glyoxalase superfamily protein PhnB